MEYHWITRKPDSTWQDSGPLTTTMTNGSASIPDYAGLLTDKVGDYRTFVRVTSPKIVESDAKDYTVKSKPLELPQQLANGQPASGNVTKNQQRTYSIQVPTNAKKLEVKITGNGDADLYVKKGAAPTLNSWDFRPYIDGSNETVTTTTSLEGTWYIMIHGYANANSGYTLTATYETQITVVGPVVYTSHQIDDDSIGDSQGNGNGKPEGSEKIELSIKLKNQGNGIADNVSAKLSTSDKDITLVSNQANFGSIQANSDSEFRKFVFSIGGNATEHDVTSSAKRNPRKAGPKSI